MLLPGSHVLTRAAGVLQVGLDPRRSVALPDTEPVRDTLRTLLGGAGPDRAADPAVLRTLAAHGLLVDERSLRPLLPGAGAEGAGPGPHAVAALTRWAGDRAPEAHRSRSCCRLDVRPFGHPLGQDLADRMLALAETAGLRGRGPGRTGLQVGVLVGVGEPDRDLVDDWTRAGTAHLLVRLVEGDAVVGPLVVPGRTACLRCVDAHRVDADPPWPLLVHQYARATAHDRADGAAEPVDPLLAAVALAWAARDLATYVDGGRPSCWSATVRLDPTLTDIETRSWWRHPGCGCGWADTMEA
jgi:bacteriocin biosynthesis cyclodehydratase domain-containing protein